MVRVDHDEEQIVRSGPLVTEDPACPHELGMLVEAAEPEVEAPLVAEHANLGLLACRQTLVALALVEIRHGDRPVPCRLVDPTVEPELPGLNAHRDPLPGALLEEAHALLPARGGGLARILRVRRSHERGISREERGETERERHERPGSAPPGEG
jgi:hypothetical protein